MTTTIRSSADGLSGIVQVNGTDQLTVNADGSMVARVTPAQGDNSKKLATTEYVLQNSIGRGQTWQNVTASRAFATTYYNTTGRSIAIFVTGVGMTGGQGNGGKITVDGLELGTFGGFGSGAASAGFAIIPPGSSYSAANEWNMSLSRWVELR